LGTFLRAQSINSYCEEVLERGPVRTSFEVVEYHTYYTCTSKSVFYNLISIYSYRVLHSRLHQQVETVFPGLRDHRARTGFLIIPLNGSGRTDGELIVFTIDLVAHTVVTNRMVRARRSVTHFDRPLAGSNNGEVPPVAQPPPVLLLRPGRTLSRALRLRIRPPAPARRPLLRRGTASPSHRFSLTRCDPKWVCPVAVAHSFAHTRERAAATALHALPPLRVAKPGFPPLGPARAARPRPCPRPPRAALVDHLC
jgi:hypothetical protein